MRLRTHSPAFIRVLYPSTIEVGNNESSNVEYRQAKIEAEEMCLQMAAEFDDVVFTVPRFPKIITDQTAWFSQEDAGEIDLNYLISLFGQLYS